MSMGYKRAQCLGTWCEIVSYLGSNPSHAGWLLWVWAPEQASSLASLLTTNKTIDPCRAKPKSFRFSAHSRSIVTSFHHSFSTALYTQRWLSQRNGVITVTLRQKKLVLSKYHLLQGFQTHLQRGFILPQRCLLFFRAFYFLQRAMAYSV